MKTYKFKVGLMKTYKFKVTVFGGGEYFARARTINRVQAETLIEQHFPDRITVEPVARLPKNQQWALSL